MTLQHRLSLLTDDRLRGMRRGIEKESLRTTPDAGLALTPHPRALGSALTHPHITTDYSESQLELITAPHATPESCVAELRQIHWGAAWLLDHFRRRLQAVKSQYAQQAQYHGDFDRQSQQAAFAQNGRDQPHRRPEYRAVQQGKLVADAEQAAHHRCGQTGASQHIQAFPGATAQGDQAHQVRSQPADDAISRCQDDPFSRSICSGFFVARNEGPRFSEPRRAVGA